MEGGRTHNVAHTQCHTTILPMQNHLYVPYPMPPSLTQSVHPVQRTNPAKVAQSNPPPAPPTAKNWGGGRARFLVDKTTKKRETNDLLYVSENNALSPLMQSFLNWFYHFYRFSYQLFLTVGALYRTVSRTYKKKYLFVFFWVLFF